MQQNTARRSLLMRVPEVAHILGQHPETTYRKVRAGEIPAVRLGPGRSAIRIPSDALDAWLKKEKA